MSSGIAEQSALIVDPDRSTVELVRPLLRSPRNFRALSATDVMSAWSLLDQAEPTLVFIAHARPLLNAPRLTRELRRSDLGCRKAPVVMLAVDPTESEILAARDAGVHEVLRKPFTLSDLLLRIELVMKKPRDWVEGVAYVGPDRRRFNSAQHSNQRRRRLDRAGALPHQARIGESLKIMKLAIEAIESDPRQALRSLRAQAEELQTAAVALDDFPTAEAAKTLKTYLESAVERGRFSTHECAKKLSGFINISAKGKGPLEVRR